MRGHANFIVPMIRYDLHTPHLFFLVFGAILCKRDGDVEGRKKVFPVQVAVSSLKLICMCVEVKN